jgi:hypothetical protein
VAFPALHLMSASRGAPAKPMSALPWFDVAFTRGEQMAEAVMLPEPVVTWIGPRCR